MMNDEEGKNKKDEGSYQNILIPEERQLCQVMLCQPQISNKINKTGFFLV